MKEKILKIYQQQPGEKIYKPEAPYERFLFVKIGLIFSMPILRLLQKINIRFHPLYLSASGLILNIIAGLLFGAGYLKLGALAFFMAFIFDLLDGPWARLTNQSSSFTLKFDHFCDRVGKLACFIGLWYSQFYLSGLVLVGSAWIIIYYSNEIYATLFLPTRFANPRNMSFSVWEASFLIFIIGPILNMCNIFLPLAVVFLYLLYIIMALKTGFGKNG